MIVRHRIRIRKKILTFECDALYRTALRSAALLPEYVVMAVRRL